jgi:CheY-like chemotaxis protein
MRTILIADDEEGIRALIATTLESPDCRLLEAEDGPPPPGEEMAVNAARCTEARAS